MAKKKNKNLKECMQFLLAAQCSGEAVQALKERFSLSDDEATGTMLVAAALLSRAQNGGDVSAVKEIRSIIDNSAELKDNKLEIIIKNA